MEKLCGIADCRMVMRQDRWCMGHLQLFLSAFWKSFLSTRRHPESLEASMTWFVFTCLAGLQASFFHTELWLSSWRVISILCLEYLICRSMKPSKNIWFYFTCSIPNTLQAPRDTDTGVLIYGVRVCIGLGRSPHHILIYLTVCQLWKSSGSLFSTILD